MKGNDEGMRGFCISNGSSGDGAELAMGTKLRNHRVRAENDPACFLEPLGYCFHIRGEIFRLCEDSETVQKGTEIDN